MSTPNDYPGTSQHQALLRSIVAYYESDPRILAVAIFGSLGRGTWDCYSDLDLDVVIADGVQIDVDAELRQLTASFASVSESVVLIVPDGDDAGDIVLKSLMEVSIRYHPLSTTSPNIVDSLRLLSGRIDRAAIEAAGLANRRADDDPLSQLLDRGVRYALEVDVALQRGQVWDAIELLHLMRKLLMELFSRTHGGQRAFHFFQAKADAGLQARLGATLPGYSLASAQESLLQFLDILQNDLEAMTGGRVQLTAEHAGILNAVGQRQTRLKLR
jgi:predicted nucleotidyltransferase